MTSTTRWVGFLATLAVLTIIPVYALFEPALQDERRAELRAQALTSGTELYAENCTVCHGAAGEGLAGTPALDLETVRAIPVDELRRIISRGRQGTPMAGWLESEGGILTTAQVDDLVTLIQAASWDDVATRVAALGLTPPEVIRLEVTEGMLAAVAALPGAQTLGQGLVVFAENCAACHNANASGTLIAPALDDAAVRASPRADLVELVGTGVSGTLMAGWSGQLPAGDIEAVVELIQRWPEVVAAGVEFPQVELTAIPSSPERIAAGQALYQVACRTCHGVDAFGSRMAPALNNSIFLGETPDAAIYQIIAGGVPDTMMPAWGSRLSDYDLQVLVAYLRSMEANAPPIVVPALP